MTCDKGKGSVKMLGLILILCTPLGTAVWALAVIGAIEVFGWWLNYVQQGM